MQSINLTKEAKCNNLSCQYVDGFQFTIVADGFIMQNWMDYDVIVKVWYCGGRYQEVVLPSKELLRASKEDNTVTVCDTKHKAYIVGSGDNVDEAVIEWDYAHPTQNCVESYYDSEEGAVYYSLHETSRLRGRPTLNRNSESLTKDHPLYSVLTKHNNVHLSVYSGKWYTMINTDDNESDYKLQEVFL